MPEHYLHLRHMTSSIPLTRQQEDILEQFRRQVFQEDILREGDSIGTDDLALLRFLRARKFDLNEAKKMIKDAQHWRRTVAGVGVDELYNRLDIFDCPPLSSTLVASRSSGLGRCIFTRHVSHTTAALGLLTHPRQTDKNVHVSQDYYPERMAKLAIVNAPSSFTFIWSVVKPWLAKETAEKVDVLGSDYQGVLLELVDAESLPATLGGKCTCEHAGGCDLSGAGPWMDEGLARSTRETNHTFTVDTGADSSLSSSEPVSEPDGNRGSSAQLVGDVADRSSNVNSGVNTSSDDTAL
ncbi:CRAL-TRIO domain-containing protein [Pisolithus croceorrhizus]|nr:CRAL-TRIO domain-containing protein [Pisolithus croceorrhizus]